MTRGGKSNSQLKKDIRHPSTHTQLKSLQGSLKFSKKHYTKCKQSILEMTLVLFIYSLWEHRTWVLTKSGCTAVVTRVTRAMLAGNIRLGQENIRI